MYVKEGFANDGRKEHERTISSWKVEAFCTIFYTTPLPNIPDAIAAMLSLNLAMLL